MANGSFNHPIKRLKMKTVQWTEKSQNDTNIVARGFSSIKEANKAAANFCEKESRISAGTIVIKGEGDEDTDNPGTFYYSTDCVFN